MATVTPGTQPADAGASSPLLGGFLGEFRRFLDNYGVVGLAIAFVIGQALSLLVQAVVAGLLMPLVNPALSLLGEDWRTAEAMVGSVGPFLVGQLVYAAIYFLLIALFVFGVAKLLLRQKEVRKL